jgi:cytochrome c oxidase assembly factor CtaG
MTGWQLLTSTWEWHPSVMVGCGLLLGAYLAATRCRLAATTAWFAGGVVTMFLALVSPLDPLGDDYLFSAHMMQHILLDMVVPPCFVLGMPADLVRSALRWHPAAVAERILSPPAVAWFLGTFTLFIWHAPTLYNATLESDSVHIFEHLTFLVTGTILWWPVFNRVPALRLAPMMSVLYLALAALANGVLGIFFSLSSAPYYEAYLNPKDELELLPLLRGKWGLDPLSDQQLGGGFMWVLGSIIYLWAIVVVVVRWYQLPDTDGEPMVA